MPTAALSASRNFRIATMPLKTFLFAIFMVTTVGANAQVRAVESPGSNESNLPRSSAIDAGDYMYISGQSGQRSDGTLPADFEAQATQSLENIKSILSAAGLNLQNVVYTQVYLEDVNNYDRLNSVFAKYFPVTPPARAVLGVAKVPQGSVEITAVAVRNLGGKKSRHARELQVYGTIFSRHPHPRSLVCIRHAGSRSGLRRRPRRSCCSN